MAGSTIGRGEPQVARVDAVVMKDEWRVPQRERAQVLRKLLIDEDVDQIRVAEEMGIHESVMSKYMRARRQWPAGFEAAFREVVAGLSRRAS